jgi:hypothetical protein
MIELTAWLQPAAAHLPYRVAMESVVIHVTTYQPPPFKTGIGQNGSLGRYGTCSPMLA